MISEPMVTITLSDYHELKLKKENEDKPYLLINGSRKITYGNVESFNEGVIKQHQHYVDAVERLEKEKDLLKKEIFEISQKWWYKFLMR